MRVFKFGGASVKDAASIKNLAKIVQSYNSPLIIVVSAMGKTTNALEGLVSMFFSKDKSISNALNKIKEYHLTIMEELFDRKDPVFDDVVGLFIELDHKLREEPSMTYNFEYDQIVSYGELLSTTIVEAYLKKCGSNSLWLDIRKYLKTDTGYREAIVDFENSERLIKKAFSKDVIFVTQGFLGSTTNNLTTTLGREGSDYTAALLAYFLNAESVTVWKDVPGVLNADPKWFDNTIKIENLKYSDAIELAFYGASVIHPKTIQPLKRKNIPLMVMSFLEPDKEGTRIGNVEYDHLIPCFIFKMDQILIDIYPSDLSFIGEDNFKTIFDILAQHGLKVNLMQNTAVHFRICVNNDASRLPMIKKELSRFYEVKTTFPLELITIRYYDQKTIDRVMVNKEMILDQRTQTTIQILVKDLG